ncbi:hypothetical protein DFJ74DRAFT_118282 [Hyaloraphidium curvatum]|nr:hypothetical protein DFJ74DRAFT_118282 [Hyaloraphidium curvatum]
MERRLARLKSALRTNVNAGDVAAGAGGKGAPRGAEAVLARLGRRRGSGPLPPHTAPADGTPRRDARSLDIFVGGSVDDILDAARLRRSPDGLGPEADGRGGKGEEKLQRKDSGTDVRSMVDGSTGGAGSGEARAWPPAHATTSGPARSKASAVPKALAGLLKLFKTKSDAVSGAELLSGIASALQAEDSRDAKGAAGFRLEHPVPSALSGAETSILTSLDVSLELLEFPELPEPLDEDLFGYYGDEEAGSDSETDPQPHLAAQDQPVAHLHLSEEQQQVIFARSHGKLVSPRRSLHEQVLISNLMLRFVAANPFSVVDMPTTFVPPPEAARRKRRRSRRSFAGVRAVPSFEADEPAPFRAVRPGNNGLRIVSDPAIEFAAAPAVRRTMGSSRPSWDDEVPLQRLRL